MPIVRNTMSSSLVKINKKIVKLPAAGHKYWKAITPKDTGNAKNKTRLKGDTLTADYNYASYLDKGHSKQAPRGMSTPTKEYLNKLVKTIRK